MAETATDATSVDRGFEGAAAGLDAAVSAVVSVVKWVLLLNVTVVWLLFWTALARHHLSMGNAPAVVLSVVPLVVPVAFLIRRLLAR